jgi:hypothetical protein
VCDDNKASQNVTEKEINRIESSPKNAPMLEQHVPSSSKVNPQLSREA